jgi:hypothetical protein
MVIGKHGSRNSAASSQINKRTSLQCDGSHSENGGQSARQGRLGYSDIGAHTRRSFRMKSMSTSKRWPCATSTPSAIRFCTCGWASATLSWTTWIELPTSWLARIWVPGRYLRGRTQVFRVSRNSTQATAGRLVASEAGGFAMGVRTAFFAAPKRDAKRRRRATSCAAVWAGRYYIVVANVCWSGETGALSELVGVARPSGGWSRFLLRFMSLARGARSIAHSGRAALRRPGNVLRNSAESRSRNDRRCHRAKPTLFPRGGRFASTSRWS